jgi:dipeptidyl-peptidase-4
MVARFKKIATFKQDQRNVSDMYLVTNSSWQTYFTAWKYPLPGDKEIPMIHRVMIDVDAAKSDQAYRFPPIRTGLHWVMIFRAAADFGDVDWKEDGTQLAFVSSSRDHKQEKFRIADAATGAVREVFEETSAYPIRIRPRKPSTGDIPAEHERIHLVF